MSGHHPFAKLKRNFTEEQRRQIADRKAQLRQQMALHELRVAHAMTQKAVGELLKVKQPAVAKLERRTDMYVSNLRSYIEAVGGTLRIIADFPQGSVSITNFSEVGREQTTHEYPPQE